MKNTNVLAADILPIMFRQMKIRGYICPFVFGENDPFIASDNEPSDSNHGITLKRSKIKFLKHSELVKKKWCIMSDYQEMMKKKFLVVCKRRESNEAR